MKQLSALAIFFLLILPVFGQVRMNDSVDNPDQHFFQPKKFNYGLSLGSQFTSMQGFGSALNTWVAPSISYNVNKRLSIGGGFSIIQSNYFNARSYVENGQNSFSNGSFSSATLFINGQYLINDRLTVWGSAFKQFPITNDPLPYNPFNPVSKKGAQGVDFNVGYRIGKNFYIQAGFRYTDGINPYNTGQFYNDPFQTGFGVPGGGYGRPRW